MFVFLGGCKEISIQLASDFKNVGIKVIPGEKICPSCKIKLTTFKADGAEEPSCSYDHEDEGQEHIPNDFLKERLNSSLTSMNISPLKMHAVASHSKVTVKRNC